MQETEAKFFVLDLDGIRMRLQTLEAHLIQPRVLETNIRFDLPDSSLSIPVRDGRLGLGTWQGIYIFEHRARGHRRRVQMHLIGES